MCTRANIASVLVVLFCLPLCFCADGPETAEQVSADPASVSQAVDGNNRFAWELYEKLLKEKKGKNMFFSPTSISTALAMTYAGAKGDTAKEMAKVFHFDLAKAKLHLAYRKMLNDLNDPDAEQSKQYELTVANALWGQKGYKWLNSFMNVTKKNYGAGLQEVDFARETEKARVTINRWVEKKTNNKIKDLIPNPDKPEKNSEPPRREDTK